MTPLDDGEIRLDGSRASWPPRLDGALFENLDCYPPDQPDALAAALAALYGAPPDRLLLTRGASDALDLLIRVFCRQGVDRVATARPVSDVVAWSAALQGAALIEAPLGGDLRFDPDAFLAAIREAGGARLAVIGSPGGATGEVIDPATILRLCDSLPDTLLVVDASLAEFADPPDPHIARPLKIPFSHREKEGPAPARAWEDEGLLSRPGNPSPSHPLRGRAPPSPHGRGFSEMSRENLVVLRSLSRAFAIPGARIGALIAAAEIVEAVARALPPSALPGPSIAAAMAVLSPARRPLHDARITGLRQARARLADALATSPFVTKVHPGSGDFVLIEVEDAPALASRLAARGVRVAFLPKLAPSAVRVGVGDEAATAALLAAFGIEAATAPARRAEVVRETKETSIAVVVDLDRASPRRIATGIGFFDHMLDQVAAHGGFSLVLTCAGDLEIDAHHSLEDCALAMGAALSEALGARRGVGRFGFALPMDETEAQVLVDLGGRPFALFEGVFAASHIGDYPTEMTAHVFRSLGQGLGAAIHVRVSGDNDHHKTEACFKAFGRALRQAIAIGASPAEIPSTKGRL